MEPNYRARQTSPESPADFPIGGMPGLENGLELAGTSGSRELDQSDVTPMALVAGPKQRLPWEDRDDSMSPSQFTENSSMHRIHSCVHRDASVVRQSPYRVLVAASLLTAMAGMLCGVYGGFCRPRAVRGMVGFALSLASLLAFGDMLFLVMT